MDVILQTAVNGILLGGLYGLIAMGLNLIFGVMGIINVAHGEFMIIAAAGSYLLYKHFGWSPFLSLLVFIPVLFVIGVLLQRFVVERIQGADELMSLLLLFGLGIGVSQLITIQLGGGFFSVTTFDDAFVVGNVRLAQSLTFASLSAFVLAALLFWYLKKSAYGRAIRATSSVPELAAANGIDVRRVRAVTFGIGAALAGAAGSLMVTSQALNPQSGDAYLLIAFAACVLGGLGSVGGGLGAGLVLAEVQLFSAQLVNTRFAEMAIYIAFIVILLVRPAGLFRRRPA